MSAERREARERSSFETSNRVPEDSKMIETMCICCGAEIDRPWSFTVPIDRSMCTTCTLEVEAAGNLTQIEQLAAQGSSLY